MPSFPGDPPIERMPRLRGDQIAGLVAAGTSPRAARMRTYRAYFDGTAYVGRLPFLETRFEVPLRERAPCVVSDCVRSSARANAARCLGEGRFPTLTTLQNEDDAAFDDRFGLSPDESTTLDAVIAKVVDQADAHTAARLALEGAQAVGTACSLQCVDASGQLSVQDLPAEWCTPTFDPSGDVRGVELRYRYVDSVLDPQSGAWFSVVREYRRWIDDVQDATFYPRLVIPGDATKWVIESQRAHGLGFCPVVWYPFLASGSSAINYDGRPLHDNKLENLDALNFALSQRHRGALVCGEPQYWASGVDDDDIRGGRGRPAAQNNPVAMPTADNPQGRAGNPNGKTGWAQALSMPAGSGSRLKRSPLSMWTAEDSDAKFGMLSMPGDGLSALTENAKEILADLRETFGVVFLDPSTLRGTADISGKALLVMNERQVAFCDSIRRDFWRRWLRPVICQFLRIVLARADKGLYLGGATKAVPILKKFVQPVEAVPVVDVVNGSPISAPAEATTRWFDPQIEARWGDYFPPSDLDESNALKNVRSAREGRLITEKTALEKIAPIFNLENVDLYQEELHKDLEENPPIVVGMGAATFEPRSIDVEEEKAEQEKKDAAKAAAAAKPPPFGGGGPPKPSTNPVAAGKPGAPAATKPPAKGAAA